MVDHLIKPCVDIFATEFPFILTQGNLECHGSFLRHIPPTMLIPRANFIMFSRGAVRFVVLDSEEDKADDAVDYGGLIAFDRYRETQKKWLEKEVESPDFKKADFRIVFDPHISLPFSRLAWNITLSPGFWPGIE